MWVPSAAENTNYVWQTNLDQNVSAEPKSNYECLNLDPNQSVKQNIGANLDKNVRAKP